ncbi:hypothetical protein [Streptomyces sp. MMG1533]|nr:hypothetical protein [Streptomyces sp. MMG1533]
MEGADGLGAGARRRAAPAITTGGQNPAALVGGTGPVLDVRSPA